MFVGEAATANFETAEASSNLVDHLPAILLENVQG
jgi:hypothetical protein